MLVEDALKVLETKLALGAEARILVLSEVVHMELNTESPSGSKEPQYASRMIARVSAKGVAFEYQERYPANYMPIPVPRPGGSLLPEPRWTTWEHVRDDDMRSVTMEELRTFLNAIVELAKV